MTGSRLHRLPSAPRKALAALLLAAALGYLALLLAAYFQLTPPSALYPDRAELARLLLETPQPKSRIERLLESTTGEMNRDGTMRPAFTEQSAGWEELTKEMQSDELAHLTAQREAERAALLNWVRTGASSMAYQEDDHPLSDSAAAALLTPKYLQTDAADSTSAKRVRIRTLIADRCVTCHGEDGRHETARFIALDRYELLVPHLKPELVDGDRRSWLVAVLLVLYPLAVLAVPAFALTRYPRAARWLLPSVTLLALAALAVCWALQPTGPNTTSAVLSSALVAAAALLVQLFGGITDLWSTEP